MELKQPFLNHNEGEQKLPVLIVDKNGRIGTALAEALREQFLVVLVTGRTLGIQKNIIHVPYRRRIPVIPDNVYSHIFLIYNGELEMLDMLATFVKKANEVNGRILFITSIFETSEKLFRHLAHHRYYHIIKVIYGELFDQSARDKGTVNVFLQQARLFGKIEIPNDGMGKVYPVLFADVLAALIAIAFASQQTVRPILAFPSAGYSEISIARILEKLHPTLKIDFKQYQTRPLPFYWPADSVRAFTDYNLEDRLKQIPIILPDIPVVPTKARRRFGRPRLNSKFTLAFSTILFTLFILPLILFLIFLAAGGAIDAYSFHSFESGDSLTHLRVQAIIAGDMLGIAATIEPDVFLFATAPSIEDNLAQTVVTLEEAANTELDILQAAQIVKTIYAGQSSQPKADFLQALALLKKSFTTVQKMQAEKELPRSVLAKLHSLYPAFPLLENTIDTFPQLLGFTGTKTYLVLFQNNMEIRPGGGFIGSYGILQLTNGKMADFQTFDVYDADGKLKQSITPPFALQRYLGASHWFLRDSNFDPDFTHDAADAMQFYKLETGKSVDGVIAIDTDVFKALLATFGPVYLPDYHLQVTADNFYLLTEQHAENNFFPGSTQKRDFLRSLVTALELKISQEKSLPFQQLITIGGDLLEQKHLLLALPQQASQTIFTVNDLSGSLWDGRQEETNSLLDYLGVVDANLGTNKANYYVKREIEQEVSVSASGSASETITVTYINQSTPSSPFGGDYKNYIRFLLPASAAIRHIAIDNQIQQITPAITDPAIFTAPGFVPPSGLEVETSAEEGKRIYGFFMTVPVGKTVVVSISYSLGDFLHMQTPAFTYDDTVFKQPGTENDPYTLLLAYPNGFIPINAQSGFTNVGGKLLYNGRLNQDQNLHIEFSKQ